MRHRITAAVIAAVLSLPIPAYGHTDQELAAWQQSWMQRVEANGGILTRNLIWEYTDMRQRHRCQLAEICPQAARSHAVRAASGSGVYRGMGSNVEQWRPLVTQYFAAGLVDHALCVMLHESGGNPWADNPYSSASGLFQHLARYWPERAAAAGWAGASIWDPEANTAVAAWLQATGGWGHWTANRYC